MTITIGYTADLDSRGTRASAVLWLFVEQIESAEDVHGMMRSCWEMNAVRRPSFSQLVQWLRRRLRPVMRDSLISSTRSIIDQRQSTPCDRCVTLNLRWKLTVISTSLYLIEHWPECEKSAAAVIKILSNYTVSQNNRTATFNMT